ncbi:hypothetical protein Tco_0491521 [Tanacetum coccineum]
MMSDHISSGLALQRQMTSDHISSGLALQRQMTYVHSSLGLALQCQMTSDHFRSGLRLHQMASKYFRLEHGFFKEEKSLRFRLVQNPYPFSLTPYVPPIKKDWDILFQPLFEEYFPPPSSVMSPVLPAAIPLLADTTGTPLSTTIDKDASFATPLIHNLIPDSSSEESSSKGIIPSNVLPANQPFEHLSK